jgi:hypothetical protein
MIESYCLYQEVTDIMTREELDKRLELEKARNRAAIEKADAFFRWFDREAPIRKASTDRVFRELSESVRRR